MAIPTAANTGVPTAKPGANRPGLIVATGIHANGEAGTGAMPAASAVTPRQVRDEVNTGGTVNRADMIAIAAVPAIMTVGTSPATATATAGVPAGTIIAATGTTGTGAVIIAMPAATGMAAIRVGTITAVITATPAGTAMAATRPGIAAINAGDYHDNRRDRRWGNDRGRHPGAHHDRRRWEYAQRRRDFYRDRARRQARLHWVHHMNRGWSNTRYYGHWGPSDRWRYHRQYYSRGYEGRRFAYYDGLCRYDRNGSDGAIVGALLGALVGGAAAGDDSVGAGILLGAGFGAALGSSLDRMDNCDRAQYHYAMNYAFEYGEPYYWANPYSGVRGVVRAGDYHRWGPRECRWGDAEIFLPNGRVTYDRVRMCRDNYGGWEVARRQ